jgi:hypothetical protein
MKNQTFDLRKIILFIAFTAFALFFMSRVIAQAPMDSATKVKVDSLRKLIATKMVITPALIDSTFSRIESSLTVKQYSENHQAFQFFVRMMELVWLEDNRKKQKVK